MLDVPSLRAQFPSLQRRVNGRTPIYLDGPGGTQVPQTVIDAMVRYLSTHNANHQGAFTTSRESDAVLYEAHRAVADLLNGSPEEVVFGPNMTTLTFHLSRSIGKTLRPGDEVVVTRLDHDANVRPWARAAEDAGAAVRFVDIHPEDCTLDLDDLRGKLNERTKLVAVTCASNAVGTLPDVRDVIELAHAAGAVVFLDAVHYAPHGLIDVRGWGCDFLACSPYKFFGPHSGVLWGKRELLESLPAYKVNPASDAIPDRWMTGTQNHEGIAGVAAAVEYLASIAPGNASTRRARLENSYASLHQHEMKLAGHLLNGLLERQRYRIWGLASPDQLDRRAPTFAITASDRDPLALAEHLATHEIYAWHGNYYAQELAERLGVEETGGWLRLGLVHYNTTEEVDRLLEALDAAP
jgi:cysteine desulfurase family protein (TIGR01976 family)